MITYSPRKFRFDLNFSILNQYTDFPTYRHSFQVRAGKDKSKKKKCLRPYNRFFTLKQEGRVLSVPPQRIVGETGISMKYLCISPDPPPPPLNI